MIQLKKGLNEIEKRQLINDVNTIADAELIKQLLDSIPVARAYDFFDKLKDLDRRRRDLSNYQINILTKILNKLIRNNNDMLREKLRQWLDKIRKEKEEEERKRKEEEDRINKGKLTLDELSTNNLKTNDETINNQKLRGRYNKNLGNDIYSDEDEKLYNELKEKRRRLNLMKDKYTQYLDLNGIDIDNLDSDELEILENLYQAQLKDVDKTKKLLDKIRSKRKGDLLKNSTNYFKSSLKDTEDQIKEKIMKFKRERNERHKTNRES